LEKSFMVIGESGFRFVERFNDGGEKRIPERPLLRRINPIVGRIFDPLGQWP
jgi:hypothetical protein